MAWTASLGVSVGDATKETHYDQLAANAEFNKATAGVTLDMDASTGDGYIWADNDNPLIVKNADATPDYISLALHVDAQGGNWLAVRVGVQASVTAANAEGFIEIKPISEAPGGVIPA